MNPAESAASGRATSEQAAARNTGVKSKLIAAASRLIDETEQWTWSIREICDEAQLPYNSFYRTFRHKHALVEALSACWRAEIEAWTGKANGTEPLVRHVEWLVSKRRRVRFLAIEIGVYEGCNVSIADLGMLMPSRPAIVAALVQEGSTLIEAQRRALSCLIFLLVYLSSIDALRSNWAEDCGFDASPPQDRMNSLPASGARASELAWVLENLGLLAVGPRTALSRRQ